MPSMIAIVHSIYSQSVHAPASHAGLMDNEAERYCISSSPVVSEPNPSRPLLDLQYGLGETVFGGCRHLEYMNIWGFNEPK